MRTVVIGVGGLGGFLGAHLARAGADVAFVARRATLEALRSRGLMVRSPRGDFSTQGLVATDDAHALGTADLVLLCVKTYDLEAGIEAARPVVGTGSMVLPVQNGIAHVDRLREAYGQEAVLGGLSMINALRDEPTVVRHIGDVGEHQLEFGEWLQPVSERCEAVQAHLQAARIDAVAEDDIALRMWWKLAVICGAAVFAVARGGRAIAWTPEIQTMVRRAVSEVVAVAHVQGIPLLDSVADEMVAIIDNAPPTYRPSMLDDLEASRPLEVHATSGYVSALAARLGVPTPTNDFVYACLQPHAAGGA